MLSSLHVKLTLLSTITQTLRFYLGLQESISRSSILYDMNALYYALI
jgi:hypothetical protein